MNALFHIAAGASVIAGMSHAKSETAKDVVKLSSAGFFLGLLSHGILDYTPHCYPLNSKVDAILGLLLILLIVWKINWNWKAIAGFTLLGCVIPDIIDLAPEILNSLFNLGLPTFDKLFPWHLREFSGSIYTDECKVSAINHWLTILFCAIVVLLNVKSLKRIMNS